MLSIGLGLFNLRTQQPLLAQSIVQVQLNDLDFHVDVIEIVDDDEAYAMSVDFHTGKLWAVFHNDVSYGLTLSGTPIRVLSTLSGLVLSLYYRYSHRFRAEGAAAEALGQDHGGLFRFIIPHTSPKFKIDGRLDSSFQLKFFVIKQKFS